MMKFYALIVVFEEFLTFMHYLGQPLDRNIAYHYGFYAKKA